MLPEYRTIYNQLSKGGLRGFPLPPLTNAPRIKGIRSQKAWNFCVFQGSIPLTHNVSRQANCYEPLFLIILDESIIAV